MKLAAVALLGVALTAAGIAAQGKDDPAIAKVRSAYQAAAGSQDAAALAKLYTADGVEMPPNAPAAKGRAAIEAFTKARDAFTERWIRNLKSGVSDTRFVDLPGAGHFVFLTREAEVVKEIRDFVANLK